MKQVVARLCAGRTAILTTAGLGLLDAAAWELATAAGLAAAGVSLLLLDWLIGDAGHKDT